jgi:hypothetical protein
MEGSDGQTGNQEWGPGVHWEPPEL